MSETESVVSDEADDSKKMSEADDSKKMTTAMKLGFFTALILGIGLMISITVSYSGKPYEDNVYFTAFTIIFLIFGLQAIIFSLTIQNHALIGVCMALMLFACIFMIISAFNAGTKVAKITNRTIGLGGALQRKFAALPPVNPREINILKKITHRANDGKFQ
tara:strand:- start:34 stop:519 length:486 start_codon:yes stop_codon:yes gene_type:complete